MNISEFQELMRNLYLHRDQARGIPGTFTWFVEEVGELAHELRQVMTSPRDESVPASLKHLEDEFADVFAWLCSLANLAGIDLERAATGKYPGTCSKCGNHPCTCTHD
ncbi:nucleotide pyrophosphohydrolase [Candidatus Bathyarchaeota archaeon]|nr:nucleotide pyrophosphohydrolase [Candidatus Bathyarchaeota archaeon]